MAPMALSIQFRFLDSLYYGLCQRNVSDIFFLIFFFSFCCFYVLLPHSQERSFRSAWTKPFSPKTIFQIWRSHYINYNFTNSYRISLEATKMTTAVTTALRYAAFENSIFYFVFVSIVRRDEFLIWLMRCTLFTSLSKPSGHSLFPFS